MAVDNALLTMESEGLIERDLAEPGGPTGEVSALRPFVRET